MNYYERHAADERIASRASNLFHVGGNTYSFPESGNTFHGFTAAPYGNYVALAPDRETFLELAAHYECGPQEDEHWPTIAGRCTRNATGIFIIGVFDGKASTLVHETGHATIGILEWAGLITRASNDEAFCYLQMRMFEAFEGAL